MPFRFVYLCDLLHNLEKPYLRDAPLLPRHLREYQQRTVTLWLQKHRESLNEFSTKADVVMSMLRPGEWADRDFGMDVEDVERLIARILAVTREQYRELQRYKTEPYNGDLGAFVERVMVGMDRVVFATDVNSVTVEEVDQILLKTASRNPSSSTEIHSLAAACKDFDTIDAFANLYERLKPREAKWLTRILLKTIEPAKFPADLGLESNQSNLPNCVKLHVEFPSSTPVALQLGGTGVWKSSTQQTANKTSTQRSSPARGSSPGGSLSVRATVTKPVLSKQRPVITTQASTSSTRRRPLNESPRRNQKRRYISRGSSPGPIVFQRGVLRPIRSTEISNNSSQPTSLSNPSSKTPNRPPASPRNTVAIRPGARCPTFQLGISRPSPKPDASNLTLQTPPSLAPSPKAHNNASYSQQVRQTEKCPESQSLAPSCQPEVIAETQRPIPVKTAGSHSTLMTPLPSSAPILPTPPAPTSTVIRQSTKSKQLKATLPSPLVTAGRGKCRLATGTCPLTNYILLLSPLIPKISYIQEKLLPWHGSLYLTSLTFLSHLSLPRHCPLTRKKYRKIVLVETHTNYTKETGDFLKKIESLNLKRSGGRKQWVEVYDWRLLECMAKIDQGKRLDYCPWKRCFICVV
ncbi:hypothetical protein G7Y89_g11585 [Cudoniella acicularis]|uniref:DNA ligase ATP-dependent N-terminal domain-containing protein n=1 Tax=Cudoniella acicularis TaxID=354080 RepID=A0A8H4RBP8_9HELO|nr:hypothetical protein G7Y89_g11585 [Cudoniella acicularis]